MPMQLPSSSAMPFIELSQMYGLDFWDEWKEYSWSANLGGKDFKITVEESRLPTDPWSTLSVSFTRGEALRLYSEELYTVLPSGELSLAEILRYRRIPPWKLWKKRKYPNDLTVNWSILNTARGQLEEYLSDVLEGNLTRIFEQYKTYALLPVYRELKSHTDTWAAQHSLEVAWILGYRPRNMGYRSWTIEFRNPRTGVIAHLTVARQFEANVWFGQETDGEFKAEVELWQVTRHRAISGEHYRYLRDSKRTRWKSDPVTQKLKRFLDLIDKYGQDILSGETPLNGGPWSENDG